MWLYVRIIDNIEMIDMFLGFKEQTHDLYRKQHFLYVKK